MPPGGSGAHLEAPTQIPRRASTLPAPSFQAAIGVSERVQAFADWLIESSETRALYIADAEGLPLYARGVSEVQSVSAVVIERAMRSLRGLLDSRPLGSVTVELDDGRIMQTIWCHTDAGRAAIGLFPPAPVPLERINEIRAALRRVFEG
jgi:hypothetical protein